MMLAAIAERCNAIEECYEFMLAYAALGLPTEEGSEYRWAHSGIPRSRLSKQ